ncbi:transmembrane protein 183-like isoform X1 [Haliotis asinina]|uniref:transmembrane protein 183-like isoform X1 n=1 Tax=Haliotis asinina TaxID=109174 RepID=UPI003531F47D
MPRVGRKGRLQKKAVYSTFSDVTLNDYANADKGGGSTYRVKKGAARAIEKEVRQLMKEPAGSLATVGEDLSWFEKDLEDFHIGTEDDKDQTVEENGECEVVETRRRRRKTKSQSEGDEKGLVYPYDLWYQLSLHVHPEDVGRFAGICRTACCLVYSSAFWRNMYLRYFEKSVKLPDDLQPSNIERIRGLRARVIRSMFYLYRPLADRTTPLVPFENEPHQLQGQRCHLSWHQPVKNMWNFCFKFTKGQPSTRPFLPTKMATKNDLLPGYNDLFYNTEDGCRILQVTVQNFVSIPMVMGLVLSKVYLTISAQMRYYRLRMLFDTNLQGGNSNSAEMIVDLDPVVNIRVLPWWDPKYPFTC